MSDRQKPPEAIDIAEYWNSQPLIETEEGLWDAMVDIGEPACQACGAFNSNWDIGKFTGDWSNDRNVASARWEKSGLEKAHIIPNMNNGPNLPKNFLMLCRPCHLEFDSCINISHESGMKHVYKWLINQPEKRRKDTEHIVEEFVKSNNIDNKMFVRGTIILECVGDIFNENQKLRFYEAVEELEKNINKLAKNYKERLLMRLEQSLAVCKIATEDQLRLDLDFVDWCKYTKKTMDS